MPKLGIIFFGIILISVTLSSYADPVQVIPVTPPSLSDSGRSEYESPASVPVLVDLPSYDFQQQLPGKIGVGDLLEFKLADEKILWSSFDLPSNEDLSELGWFLEAKPALTNTPSKAPHLAARPVKAGRLTLPSLILKDSAGKAIAQTRPFTVDIASSISPQDPHPDQPYGLEPPQSLQFPLLFLVVFGLVVFLATCGFIYAIYYWVRKHRDKLKNKSQIILSEDEVALGQLAELEKSQLIEQKLFKKYYFRLSEVVKIYIGSRYHFDAPESTSGEIVKILEDHKEMGDLWIDQLENLFEKLDRVKFTDFVPELSEPLYVLEEAKNIIRGTRRIPTSPSHMDLSSREPKNAS